MKNKTLMFVNVSEILETPKQDDILLKKQNIVNTDVDFSNREKVYGWMTDSLKDAQVKATKEKPIPFYVEIRICTPGNSVIYMGFTEIMPDGFYVYPWIKESNQAKAGRDLFEGYRNVAMFVENASDVLSLHTERADIEWKEVNSRNAWMKKYARKEYQEVKRLVKALNRAFDGEEVRKLRSALKDAQDKLKVKYAEDQGRLAS